MKTAVQQLIAQELSQVPEEILNDYDAFLASRYSNLWTASRIEESMKRFEKTGMVTNQKIDCQDYTTINPPEPSMENDVQVNHIAFSRVK